MKQDCRLKHGKFVLFIMLLISSSVHADLNDGLVAYYPFNGNANDESGNGNDGTVNGATLTEDRFGNVDSAYMFDGVNDYIVIPNSETLNSKRITVSAWYFSTGTFGSTGANNVIIHKPYTSHSYPHYQWHVGGAARYSIGEWHHIVGTFEPDNSYDTDVFIGKHGNLSTELYHTLGIIDDIRIYNRVLSEEEIQELYSETNEPQVSCSEEPATYSNETRQAILPCLEIPLYTDINGSSINITGLYSAVLEIPFGFSDFEAKELTFLEIIEEPNPTHARFNPDSGVLDIPRIDVPTTVPLLVGGTVPGPTLQCSAELQQSALRPEVLILQEFDCNLP